MEAFIAFVAKYWLGFVLAAMGAGVTALWNKIKDTYKLGKKIRDTRVFEDFKEDIQNVLNDFKKDVVETIEEKENNMLNIIQTKEQVFERALDAEDRAIEAGIKDLTENHKNMYKILENSREISKGYRDLYQQGLLYILRRTYFEDCERLLRPDHVITFDEFKTISEDHQLYNKLGGNHQGDIMFEAIEDKYHHQTL